MPVERFCDNITNLSLPLECRTVLIPNHKVPGNFYATDSKIKEDADMSGLSIGGNAYMMGLSIGGNAYMSGLSIGGNAYMNRLKIKKLYLDTKERKVIPYLSLENSVIEEFVKRNSILVKDFTIRSAKIPKTLQEALEEGKELAKYLLLNQSS